MEKGDDHVREKTQTEEKQAEAETQKVTALSRQGGPEGARNLLRRLSENDRISGVIVLCMPTAEDENATYSHSNLSYVERCYLARILEAKLNGEAFE